MLLRNSIVRFTLEITCSVCRKKEKPGREVACSENSANLANFGTKVASTQMKKLFLIFCPPSLCSALLFVSHLLLFLTFLLLLTFRSVCPCCRTLCSGRAGRSAKATTHQCQVTCNKHGNHDHYWLLVFKSFLCNGSLNYVVIPARRSQQVGIILASLGKIRPHQVCCRLDRGSDLCAAQ